MHNKIGKTMFVLLFLLPIFTLVVNLSVPDIAVYFRRMSVVVMIFSLFAIGMALGSGQSIIKRLQETKSVDKLLFLLLFVPVFTMLAYALHFDGRFNLRGMLTLVVVWYGFMICGVFRHMSPSVLARIALGSPFGMIIYGIAIGVLFLVGFFPADYDWLENGGMPGFLNIRHIGYLLAPCAATVIGFAVATDRENRRAKWGYIAAASVLWALLIWAGSRGGFVALVGSLGVGFLVLRGHRLEVLKVASIVLVLGSILSFAYPSEHRALGYNSMISKSIAKSNNVNHLASGRLNIAKAGLSGAFETPFLGHGIDTFKFTEIAARSKVTHAHNTFANYAYSVGFIGAGALMIWLYLTWFRFGVTARTQGNPISVGVFLNFGTVLFFGLLDGVFFHYESIFYIVTILAVGYANMTHVSQNGTGPRT